MKREQRDYAEIYRSRSWAYSDKPDPELIRALVGIPRGRAVDLGGGQGRHALALAALGFNVALVDSVAEGLHQASAAADERGLPIEVIQSDAADYAPGGGIDLLVAALLFHLLSRRKSLKIAERVGQSLRPGGMVYVSVPGYTKETVSYLEELIDAAGCQKQWVVKHLVTKKERPRLQVSRRNEARALGRKLRTRA
jgi:2-polyprenyl-3-methyl-5-hydroxy-6-metoxy-1,4-benzoquinol methylase